LHPKCQRSSAERAAASRDGRKNRESDFFPMQLNCYVITVNPKKAKPSKKNTPFYKGSLLEYMSSINLIVLRFNG